MDYKPWMDSITVEDLPNDDLKFVAVNAGMRCALTLILSVPGLTVCIPRNALKLVKERHILNEYDGTKFSLNKLAVECEVSQRHVYKILERHLSSTSTPNS